MRSNKNHKDKLFPIPTLDTFLSPIHKANPIYSLCSTLAQDLKAVWPGLSNQSAKAITDSLTSLGTSPNQPLTIVLKCSMYILLCVCMIMQLRFYNMQYTKQDPANLNLNFDL